MKKFLNSSVALLASFLLTLPLNITEAATLAEEEPNMVVEPLGAGEWDLLGEWTFSNVIRIQSGGGDLKVCAPYTSDVIKFGVDSIVTLEKDEYTSGTGENCAVFRNIGPKGAYDIFFADSNHPSSVKVRIYD
ncbi:hypothetical protein [Schinkia azotoformans]|uniref:hypothetical protein n=1 Tax=Schinkia azotoformans TaxID=1454 RepID=UPI002DBB0871|nr:hypothetical protein [Schinkia azotoformans]MEC1720567.1 hypothetical protein [Schinkia azotoformans]MED4414103.1 hypothetical protein [Schinkia azotoformans]